jgi:hypothetical protein
VLRCGSGPGTRTAIWRSEWTSWRICCNAHSVRSKGFLVSRLGWVSPGERTTPPQERKGLTGWRYGCGTGAGIDASDVVGTTACSLAYRHCSPLSILSRERTHRPTRVHPGRP